MGMRKVKKSVDDVIALGTVISFFTMSVALAVGWVMNIMTIWHTMDAPLTAKLILRCIGVFVFPIGGILGYL